MSGILQACAAGCGTSSSKLLQCSRCHMVRYCGPKCQKRHWKQHKKECALHLEERKKGAKGAGGALLTWDARERRGQRYIAKKKWAKAEAEFRHLVALEPTCSAAHSNLGTALKSKGDLDGAIASFKQALSLDPTHANAREALAIVLRAKQLGIAS